MCMRKRKDGERRQCLGVDKFHHAGNTRALLIGQYEDAIRLLALYTLEAMLGSLQTAHSVV